MADQKIKWSTGEKAKIEEAKRAGKIDVNDLVITSDTDQLAFINKHGETKFIKDRTTEPVQFKGTSIGNWTDGKTVPEGLTFTEWLKQAAQKAIPATYSKPTVSIANNGGQASGAVESGTSITPKLRATFNKNDAGNLTKIEVLKGGTSVGNDTNSPYNYTGNAIVIGDETISFTAKATYEEGEIKNNNLGEPSPDGHVLAGSVTSSVYNITGQRNLFYGTGIGELPEINSGTIRSLVNKKLNPTQGYSFNINIAVGQQYVIFAYPATLRDVNQVMYVETNDTGMASSFTKMLVDVADARGGENGLKQYKVYSYRMATPAAAALTFKVTI